MIRTVLRFLFGNLGHLTGMAGRRLLHFLTAVPDAILEAPPYQTYAYYMYETYAYSMYETYAYAYV
jgi:hypothetical protein